MSTILIWLSKKRVVICFSVFVLLFLLSLDFWNWGRSDPLIFGLPFWVVYMLILILLTSLLFYMFSKIVWKED